MNLRTCVTPSGRFAYGVHKPSFEVTNLRERDHLAELGALSDGTPLDNQANFPEGAVTEDDADWIYEIPNPFPFKGTSYIAKSWADEKAENPAAIRLLLPPPVSFSNVVKRWLEKGNLQSQALSEIYDSLPDSLKVALATSSTDTEDLILLADGCAEFVRDSTGRPTGLVYEIDGKGRFRPKTVNHLLFEALANNRHLPDDYKRAMVLRPGAQGGSEIVGEYTAGATGTHAFEYLRRNSYIPWGHYAANMADDAVRYRIEDLTAADVSGMRHLYYQRTYTRLAGLLNIPQPAERRPLSPKELEDLRVQVIHRLKPEAKPVALDFNTTLWGWNFGFDFSPSNYRLNASHQQIHQQYSMIPDAVYAEGSHTAEEYVPGSLPAFAVGDSVAGFTSEYRRQAGRPFFDAYLEAIRTNRRIDGRNDRDSRLAIYQDDHVMLFVPKAQTSQWEIQVICLNPVGNILEADAETRRAIDRAILTAVKVLSALGARMITAFEYSKRFDSVDPDQRLVYAFLPRIPQSPGGFSENQLRWITGHYPEDFAAACRTVNTQNLDA